MLTFLKLILAVLLVYSIATAPVADKLAMYNGAVALGRSVSSACTRELSPCTAMLEFFRTLQPVTGAIVSADENSNATTMRSRCRALEPCPQPE